MVEVRDPPEQDLGDLPIHRYSVLAEACDFGRLDVCGELERSGDVELLDMLRAPPEHLPMLCLGDEDDFSALNREVGDFGEVGFHNLPPLMDGEPPVRAVGREPRYSARDGEVVDVERPREALRVQVDCVDGRGILITPQCPVDLSSHPQDVLAVREQRSHPCAHRHLDDLIKFDLHFFCSPVARGLPLAWILFNKRVVVSTLIAVLKNEVFLSLRLHGFLCKDIKTA